ncbi:protein kinase domain-containing protein [Umezawaea sp. Da 62-37]|uniref:protein kinase domain-containing protein n=1 Tax=Umezawaea sp. Da 62-37 TaxID=3075927 RepID=UPI0028F6F8D1|nr:hypothetical protein [Umezawaea sp. Da 62-37]WNV85323.1 hypothetical protein RM788_45610 [Umezawaea sp. Da 62-37]
MQQGAPSVPRGATPTRQQGRREPTVQQGAGGPRPGDGSFPAELLGRFTPVRVSGEGTEGTVWRCTVVETGATVAVKVYNHGMPVDFELLRHLSDPAFRAHVPEIHDFGTVRTPGGRVDWVAMEHLDQTAADLIATKPSAGRAKDLIAAIAECLEFWQRVVDRNPLDFKPDNLMVRAGTELRVVLADFGGVVAFSASQQMGPNFTAARAYTPPEVLWEEKRSPWPWWSLGVIAHQLALDRLPTPATGHDELGRLVMRRWLAVGVLDPSEDVDERWRLLIRGLLTKDPHDRWGYGQVVEWLDGGTPPVVHDDRGVSDAPRRSPLTFGDGRVFHDPALLAVAMLDQPNPAARWLASPERQAFDDWLDKEGLKDRLDKNLLRGLANDPLAPHRLILAFGAVFAPKVRPRWRGHPIDAAGLVELLRTGTGSAVVRELAQVNGFGIAGAYACAHGTCRGGRCAMLDRLASRLHDTVADAERVIGGVVTSDGPVVLNSGERDRLHDLAVTLLLVPGSAIRLVPEAAAGPLGHANLTTFVGPDWFLSLCRRARGTNPDTSQGLALRAATGLLRERAHGETAEQRSLWLTRLKHGGKRVLGGIGLALLSFTGMVFLAWIGGLATEVDLVISGQPGEHATAAATALVTQRAMLPVAMVLAALSAVLGGPRRRWQVLAWATTAGCALVVADLPPFTAIGGPDVLEDAVIALAGIWGDAVWLGLVICAAATVVALVPVYRRTESGEPWVERSLVGTASPARRLAVFPLLAVALMAVSWASCVMRTQFFGQVGGVPVADVGVVAAWTQSQYALLAVVVAGLAAIAWPRTGWLLAVGVLGAGVLGAAVELVEPLAAVRRDTFVEPLAWFSGLWGPGAVWAALLVHLPLAVLCVRGAYRLARR